MTDVGELRVGCPMWVNRDWIGPYFPADTPKGRELAAYGAWCSAVEGNTTFYALPGADTVARWADQAPRDFRFSFKLPKLVTHERRLRNVADDVAQFLERLAPLEPWWGPFSIQLPESFGPDDLDVLDRFLADLPSAAPWSVEVRHRAFDTGSDAEARLHDVLIGRGADRVLFPTSPIFAVTPRTPEESEAHERKPRVRIRPVALGSRPVVRLIAPDRGTEPVVDLIEPWRKWWPHVARWIMNGRSVTLFAHTPDNLRSPELARLVHDEIRSLVPELAPQPDPLDAPGQAQLFSS